jgi:phosphoglycolate phosphatase
VRRVLAAAGLDPETPGALARFLALYDERLVDNTRTYPGIPEMLAKLRRHLPLAVLTNKPQHATSKLLCALDLSRHFVHVIGGDTALGRKPDPAGLLRLCAAAGIAPGEAVLIGDSPIDLETASRAGTQVIIATYGFGYRFAAQPKCPLASSAGGILRLLSADS